MRSQFGIVEVSAPANALCAILRRGGGFGSRVRDQAMSDYMFMLESHLSADQSRAVSEIQAAATSANLNVFLTGGAMRDMLGGFPMLDIDFTIEGNAIKIAQAVAKKSGAKILSEDDNRKLAHLAFPSGVHATTRDGAAGEVNAASPEASPR